MGRVGEIVCVIYQQKNIYKPGDKLKGYWEVNVTGDEPLRIKGILLNLHGEGHAYKEESAGGGNILTVSDWKNYVYQTNAISKESLQPGRHEMPFSFRFPQADNPSSMVLKRGFVRYRLNIKIDLSGLKSSIKEFRMVRFLNGIDTSVIPYNEVILNSKTKHVSIFLGFGNAGTVSINASMNRRGFYSGETISLDVTAENNSTKNFGPIRVTLVQEIVYWVRGERSIEVNHVSKMKGDVKIKQGKTEKWNNVLMRVGDIPPSSRPGSNHLICIRYLMKVSIKASTFRGGDAALWLPLTIGADCTRQ